MVERAKDSKMKNFFGLAIRVSILNLIEIADVRWHKPLFNLFGNIEVKGTTTISD